MLQYLKGGWKEDGDSFFTSNNRVMDTSDSSGDFNWTQDDNQPLEKSLQGSGEFPNIQQF